MGLYLQCLACDDVGLCFQCLACDDVGLYLQCLARDDVGLYLQAMEDLVDAGKVKSIGLSNFNRKQLQDVLNIARIKPVALQVGDYSWVH